jgi:hypothetical protein
LKKFIPSFVHVTDIVCLGFLVFLFSKLFCSYCMHSTLCNDSVLNSLNLLQYKNCSCMLLLRGRWCQCLCRGPQWYIGASYVHCLTGKESRPHMCRLTFIPASLEKPKLLCFLIFFLFLKKFYLFYFYLIN